MTPLWISENGNSCSIKRLRHSERAKIGADCFEEVSFRGGFGHASSNETMSISVGISMRTRATPIWYTIPGFAKSEPFRPTTAERNSEIARSSLGADAIFAAGRLPIEAAVQRFPTRGSWTMPSSISLALELLGYAEPNSRGPLRGATQSNLQSTAGLEEATGIFKQNENNGSKCCGCEMSGSSGGRGRDRAKPNVSKQSRRCENGEVTSGKPRHDWFN